MNNPEINSMDSPPRRRKKRTWIIPAILLLALTLRIATLPSGAAPENAVSVNEQVISGQAQAGVIAAALTGAGTLSPAKTGEVTVPDCLEVEKYHVQNGDAVHEGDVLATVKPTAVASAIVELQQVLEELDGDLQEKSAQSASAYIMAPAVGRVKAILAQKGEQVSEVMSRDGALMLLSLDGRMKLELSDRQLQAGQSVDVFLEDGTKVPGRVDSVRQGTACITLSDEKAGFGEQVQIYGKDGNLLGEGELQINSPLKITGYYGTVDFISVSVNQKVASGGVLLRLTDTGKTPEYDALLELRQELEERMTQLYALYPDGKLLSPADGVVSGIPGDGEYEPLDAGKQGISPLAAKGAWQIVLLSNPTGAEPSTGSKPDETEPAEPEPPESKPDETEPSESQPDETEPSETDPTEPEEPPVYTGYVARVTGVDRETGMVFYVRSAQTVDVQKISDAASLAGSLVLSQPGQIAGTAIAGASIDSIAEGALLFLTEEGATVLPSGGGERPQDPMGGMPEGMMGMLGGGFSAGAGQSEPITPAYETYSLEEKTVLTLASQDSMSVEIPVDELDVLSLEKGKEVTVTLDALKGAVYTGSVTGIARTGVNSGGSSKFTVEITLPGEEKMLSGMNASVSIATGTTHAAVTIPTAALQEDGNRVFVYTGYSEKDDTLCDPVEVTTGASDQDTVEILSGLEAGQTYYYRYADSITYRFGTGA